MKIKLFYFAKVREMVGIDQEEVDVESDIKTLAELIAFLKLRGSQWQAIFDMSSSYRMAVNQELAEASAKINANDAQTIWIKRHEGKVLIHALYADDFLHFTNCTNMYIDF